MRQHPLTMAVHHRPLEKAIRDYAALESPTPIQSQTHAAELVAKALDGSEVLVLCAITDEGENLVPIIAHNAEGESFAMAATSIGRALDLDRWAESTGFAGTKDDLCYIPLSSRELLLSQLAQGSDGILFNQTVVQTDTAGLIRFGSVSLAIITQFAQLLEEGTVIPEEILTLLALEEDSSECQQIARDYFLNPTSDFLGISLFELQNVVVDGEIHRLTDVASGQKTAHMFSTNANSVMWGFKYAMELLPTSPRQMNIGFSIIMHSLPELISAMAASGDSGMQFMLDEKVLVDHDFAEEIMKVRTGS